MFFENIQGLFSQNSQKCRFLNPIIGITAISVFSENIIGKNAEIMLILLTATDFNAR